MPFSSSSGKSYIENLVRHLPDSVKDKPVLDVGAGCGTYSMLFRGQLKGPWTAVEIFEPYIEQYDLKSKYGGGAGPNSPNANVL